MRIGCRPKPGFEASAPGAERRSPGGGRGFWEGLRGASTRKLGADRARTDRTIRRKVPGSLAEQPNDPKWPIFLGFVTPVSQFRPKIRAKEAQRLPVKFNACYTFAARRGAFNGLVPSHSPGFACAEFRRCGPATGIAGGRLPAGRSGAGGAGFPCTGVVGLAGGASGRGQRGVGRRPGCECRAGWWCSDGAVGIPAIAAGHRPEVGGGDNDIRIGIGCWAHGAAPAAGRARGRTGRAPTDFEL